jgi:hypothetical protein
VTDPPLPDQRAGGNGCQENAMASPEDCIARACQWHWWTRFLPGDQSRIADIEAIRDRINRLQLPAGNAEQDRLLLDCARIFNETAPLQNCLFSRHRVLVSQRMYQITEDLLLLCPEHELKMHWRAIAALVTGESAPRWLTNMAREIDDHFAKNNSAMDIAGLRRQMRQVKISNDERLVADVWRASVLLEQLLVFSLFAVGSLVLLVFCLWSNNACQNPLDCWIDTNKHYSIVGILAAGVLGGALSALSRIRDTTESRLPLVKTSIAKPIIGGAVALTLFFGISLFNPARIEYPIFYASAIAAGFSERVFVRRLEKSEGQIGEQYSRSAGMTPTSPTGDIEHASDPA